MIIGTIGFMFGTGGTALVSKTYGQGDKERANRYFSLTVYTAFGLGLILSILGMFFIRQISILLGATGQLLEDCIVYSQIVLSTMPFFILQVMFQRD